MKTLTKIKITEEMTCTDCMHLILGDDNYDDAKVVMTTPDGNYITNGNYWLHKDYYTNDDNYPILTPDHKDYIEFKHVDICKPDNSTRIQFIEDKEVKNDYDGADITVFKVMAQDGQVKYYSFGSCEAYIIWKLTNAGYTAYTNINDTYYIDTEHNPDINILDSALSIHDEQDKLIALLTPCNDSMYAVQNVLKAYPDIEDEDAE